MRQAAPSPASKQTTISHTSKCSKNEKGFNCDVLPWCFCGSSSFFTSSVCHTSDRTGVRHIARGKTSRKQRKEPQEGQEGKINFTFHPSIFLHYHSLPSRLKRFEECILGYFNSGPACGPQQDTQQPQKVFNKACWKDSQQVKHMHPHAMPRAAIPECLGATFQASAIQP